MTHSSTSVSSRARRWHQNYTSNGWKWGKGSGQGRALRVSKAIEFRHRHLWGRIAQREFCDLSVTLSEFQYLTFRSYSGEKLVTITVGGDIDPDIEGSAVHDDCTSHGSDVFTGVFKEAFRKAKSREKDFPVTIKITPQAFGIFIQWAYKHPWGPPSASIADWISIWILADKLWIPKLQNFAINAINLNFNLGVGLGEKDFRNMWKKILREQDFPNIWKNTTTRSALRTFFADAIAICCPTFHSGNILPKNMMFDVYDVLKKSHEETGKSYVERKDRCIQKYHVNED